MGFDIRAAVLFVAITTFSSIACAQPQEILSQPDPDSPIGERNERAPEELSQYGFLIGDWDVDITLFRPEGEPHDYKAKWHNTWIVNGTVVFQEWRGPYATGAELRHYNSEENYWEGRNVYAGNASWYENIATWNEEAGEMVVRRKMTSPRGPYLNDEIYHDISENTFKIRTRVSFDDGSSWESGSYEITATRSQ